MSTQFTEFLKTRILDKHQQLRIDLALLIYALALSALYIPIYLGETDEPLSRIIAGLAFLIPINSLSLLPLLVIERIFFPIFVGRRYPTTRRLIALGINLFVLFVFFEKGAEAQAVFQAFWAVYNRNSFLIFIPFLTYLLGAYFVENAHKSEHISNDILDDL